MITPEIIRKLRTAVQNFNGMWDEEVGYGSYRKFLKKLSPEDRAEMKELAYQCKDLVARYNDKD